LFPQANALYGYDAFLAAASKYPEFLCEGDEATRRREAAAFLANISAETTGGWPAAPGGPYAWGLYFIEEVGCESGACTQYCQAGNAQYPCAPGQTYHGRGPIQLSWNYNYGQFGEVLGLPLLANPGLITSDGEIAFETAIWFWMTPQAPKPSAHDVMVGNWVPTAQDMMLGRLPGFGMTINIINGGIECGYARSPKVTTRLGFYARYVGLLGTTEGPNTDCDAMTPYG
jgi:chitinase